jgi:hypothetical protein
MPKNMQKRFLLVTLILSCILFPMPALAEQPDVGTVTRVMKEVYVVHEGQKEKERVKEKDVVLFLDTYQTEKGSRVKFLFKDDSLLTLGENTTMQITESVYDPGKDYRSTILKVLKGKVRALVGKTFRGSGSKFDVHTPTSVASARGTYFIVNVIEEEGTIKTIVAVLPGGGSVEVIPILPPDAPGGPPPTSVLVTEEKFTIISAGQPPSPPEPASVEFLNHLINATAVEDKLEGWSGKLPDENKIAVEEKVEDPALQVDSQVDTDADAEADIDTDADTSNPVPESSDIPPLKQDTLTGVTDVELQVTPECPPDIC